jgi:hypothetical protein
MDRNFINSRAVPALMNALFSRGDARVDESVVFPGRCPGLMNAPFQGSVLRIDFRLQYYQSLFRKKICTLTQSFDFSVC